MVLSLLPFFPSLGSSGAGWTTTALYVLGSFGVLILAAYVYFYPMAERSIPYRNLRGPAPTSLFWGNLREIIDSEPLVPHQKWISTYGPTLRYKIFAGRNRFFTADPVALSYILSHVDLFPKPERLRKQMADMLGNGVLIAEGHDHKRQRKILNPSFSPAAVREMVPIFFEKAYELKAKLLGMIEDESIDDAAPTPTKEEDKVVGGRKIDVMRFLGQCTLDVIGQAGFDYDFKAMKDPKNVLAEAYRDMFSAGQSITPMAIIQALVPGMDKLPTKRAVTVWNSQNITKSIGRKLVEDKKRAIAAQHAGQVEKGTDIGKDLLSILIKANMASDLKPEQRMSDDEVVAQITTFPSKMLAGNETSSTSLNWILYALTQHPEMQDRLRKECLEVDDDAPSMDTLNALPYMDAVVREALRLLAPVTSTIRHAAEDVVVPLGTPVEGRDGSMIESVRLSKGTQIFIPILVVNKSEHIWGPDSEQFNPDRFLSPSMKDSTAQKQVPGVWGNLLTFLGGNRNCIGYRFALAEIKAILFVLMRGLRFEELNSKPVVEKKSSIVMRSRIKGEEEAGLQMPLMVRPL